MDDLERDLTESQAQHAMPCVRVVPSTAVANRFSSLATESDDEQDLEDAIPPTVPASDHAVRQMSREVHMVGIDSENLSDTATDLGEPAVVRPVRRRRLVLVAQPSGATPQSR